MWKVTGMRGLSLCVTYVVASTKSEAANFARKVEGFWGVLIVSKVEW